MDQQWTCPDRFSGITSPVRAKARSLAALLNPAPDCDVIHDSRTSSLPASQPATQPEDDSSSSSPSVQIEHSRAPEEQPPAPSPSPVQQRMEPIATEELQSQEPSRDSLTSHEITPEEQPAEALREADVQSPPVRNLEVSPDSVSPPPELDDGHEVKVSETTLDGPVTSIVHNAPLLVPAAAEVPSITFAITITTTNDRLKTVKPILDATDFVVEDAHVEDVISHDHIKLEQDELSPLPLGHEIDAQTPERTVEAAIADEDTVLAPSSIDAVSNFVLQFIPILLVLTTSLISRQEPAFARSTAVLFPTYRSRTPIPDPSTLFDTDQDLIIQSSPLSSPGPSSPLLSSPLSAPPSLADVDDDHLFVSHSATRARVDSHLMDVDDEDVGVSDIGMSMRDRSSSPLSSPSRPNFSCKAQIFKNFTPKRREVAARVASVPPADMDMSDMESSPEDFVERKKADVKPAKTTKTRPGPTSSAKRSKEQDESHLSKRRGRQETAGPSKKRPRVILSEPESEMDVLPSSSVVGFSDIENSPVRPQSKADKGTSDKKSKSKGKSASVRESSTVQDGPSRALKKSDSENRQASSSKPRKSSSPARMRSRTPKAPEPAPVNVSPLPHDEMQGMLIEALATSRASSLPASALYTSMTSSHPVLKDALNGSGTVMSKKEWISVVEDALEEGSRASGVFGKVDSGTVVRLFKRIILNRQTHNSASGHCGSFT